MPFKQNSLQWQEREDLLETIRDLEKQNMLLEAILYKVIEFGVIESEVGRDVLTLCWMK